MKTVSFRTLGCKVNQYDTQAMRELFLAAGYQETEHGADVVLVNTCTVTATSDQKSRQALRKALRDNPGCAVIAAGCFAQRAPEALSIPGVRLVLGTQHRHQVVELLHRALEEGGTIVAVDRLEHIPYEDLQVHEFAKRSRAVLKIQEGCDAHCAYCIIPSVRGPSRSRPLEDIAKEARRLKRAGYQEIVLTGICLTGYGADLGIGLIDAVKAAADAGIERIRLGSLEPQWLTRETMDTLAGIPQFVRTFHLSLQSGSAAVIRRMNRRYAPEEILSSMAYLKKVMPDARVRADVIVGFPEESEEEHRESVRMIERAGFSGLHVFPYSIRQGTPAAERAQVSDADKARRAAEMGALAAGVAAESGEDIDEE